jgi:hypothetical protein
VRIADWFPDLLDRQQGICSRVQALAAGFSRHAITAQLTSGRWQRVCPGVYATFSGEMARTARLWAAILRAGDAAVLSHYTAAEVWKLIDEPSSGIHLSVPRTSGTLHIPRVVIHYSARLPASRHPAKLPAVTRVEETILDLSERADGAERAVSWAILGCQRQLTDPGMIRDAMAERGRLRWRLELGETLAAIGGGVHSPLELRYLRDVERAHGLPRGTRQAEIARGTRRERQDVRYEEFAVVVELDGLAAHPAESRLRDIRRDRANAVDGVLSLRFGWPDVAYHPCECAVQVGGILQDRGWNGTLRRCGPVCVVPFIRALR